MALFSLLIIFVFPFWILNTSGDFKIVSIFVTIFLVSMIVPYWFLAIKQIIKNLYYFKVMKKGTETQAKVVAIHKGVTYTRATYYYLKYVWQDEAGNTRQGKTSTAYEETKAKEMLEMETIAIKVYGKHSAVINEPDILEFGEHSKVKIEQKYLEKTRSVFENEECSKYCEFCGKKMDSHSKQCPHCGALHFD